MNNQEGFNPMRWDCDKQGCFNVKKRPKIELFAECFSRGINFGDVDGMVERNGNLLVLEWKESPMELPTGQRKMYERVTVGRLMTVLCAAGNAQTMQVTHVAEFTDGKFSGWKPGNLDTIKSYCKWWNAWAKNHHAVWLASHK